MKQYLFFAPVFIFIFGAMAFQMQSMESLTQENPKIVDLSGRSLKEIPDSYREQIINSEVLILDRNFITTMPEWLKEAKNLKKISLNHNPDFDFFRFAVDFQELNQIESISVSGCNIFLIPYQLTFFTKLKSLDLSYNLIPEIPYHFTFMTSLEECDLSNNKIKTTGYAFRDLQKLKSLDISSNPLNTDLLIESLAYREMDFLKLNFSDTLPEELSTLKIHTADFTFDPAIVINGQLENLTVKSFIYRSSEADGSVDDIIHSLAKNHSIQDLSLVNFKMKEVPASLIKMAQLKELNIPGIELESVTHLAQLTQLNALTVSENNLTLEQIDQLKRSLPHCLIHSDEEKLKGGGIALTIQKPIENFEVPVEVKTIDPKSASVFTSATGTTELKIPANAFVDAKGKIVSSPVQVQLTEYNDPVMVALSGIPMQIKNEDGTTGDFSSAGMFDLKATSDGQEVFPNPNALITATVYSKQTTPYNLYTFSEGTGWSLAQSAPIAPQDVEDTLGQEQTGSFTSADNLLNEEIIRLRSALADSMPVKRSVIHEPKVAIRYKKSKSNQNFTVSFDHLPMYFAQRPGGKHFEYNCPEEYDEMMNTAFLYNDYNYAADSKVMDSIKKDIRKSYYDRKNYRKRKNRFQQDEFKWDENVIVKDISIAPDLLKDDYILSFNYKGRKHQFHVVLSEEGSSASGIQKKNQKFYQNYLFADRLYNESREKALKQYNEYYETVEKAFRERYLSNKVLLEKRLMEYEKYIADGGMTMEQYENLRNRASGMMYSFQVAKFGITNCDIVASMKSPRKVKASFKDVMGKTLLFMKMIRIDKRLNAVTVVGSGENLVVDYAHNQTALLFIIDEENIGIVDSKSLRDQRDNKEIEVKVYKSDEFKPEKVRSML